MIDLIRYDRWGNQLGTITPITSTRSEEVNGEDALTFTTTVQLDKGDFLLFEDDNGIWHEHIVTEIEEIRESGGLIATIRAENSLCETMGDYMDDVRNQGITASAALSKALAPTRWTQGATSALGNASKNFYHQSVRASINDIAEAWGGEIMTQIIVGTYGVAERRVSIVSRLGSNNYKRFEYKKDLIGITRRVEADDVVTALYGYGKGLAATDEEGNETGGFSRKIKFGEINGGKDYVTNDKALAIWGRSDGHGGKVHVFGKVEFDDCEDVHELLRLTKEELERRSEPNVSYEATVKALQNAGFRYEGFALGDDVQIVDSSFNPPLELSGRILKIEWNYRDAAQTVITLGNITPTIADEAYRQAQALASLRDHAGAWDRAASAEDAYINGVINTINEVMNATGGYVYMEPGEGITVYDKPIDKNPTKAIQLNGAGFRIANSKTGDTWNWRTFGTGDGFTADLINAGVIRGGSSYWNLADGTLLFKQGMISDAEDPPKNFWNLSTGELSLSANAKIGGKTASQIATDAANTAVNNQTQTSIFNKLTNGGKTQGLYIKDGLVYINGTYMKMGTITDGVGRNSWNLETGVLKTNYMTATNIDATGTFKCGYSTNLLTLSNGQIVGSESGTQLGFIDYSAWMHDLADDTHKRGLQIQANQVVRISSPMISVAASSSTSTTTTHAATKTGSYISKIESNGNGSFTWYNTNYRFIDGFCVTF